MVRLVSLRGSGTSIRRPRQVTHNPVLPALQRNNDPLPYRLRFRAELTTQHPSSGGLETIHFEQSVERAHGKAMAFHTADYDVYVFLGDPAAQPLWHWDKWLLLMPDLDALLHVARGPASTRSKQFLPNRGGTVKFGKIGWKEPDQQKWTHGSPRTLESSPGWRFFGTELWAPAWTHCERDRSAPDIFLAIASESAFEGSRSRI